MGQEHYFIYELALHAPHSTNKVENERGKDDIRWLYTTVQLFTVIVTREGFSYASPLATLGTPILLSVRTETAVSPPPRSHCYTLHKSVSGAASSRNVPSNCLPVFSIFGKENLIKICYMYGYCGVRQCRTFSADTVKLASCRGKLSCCNFQGET